MDGKNINFDDKNINKSNFYRNKKSFIIDHIDVNKILISTKEPYDKRSSLKYFIRYSDYHDIKPLCVKLSQMIGYVKHFDGNMAMPFKVIIKGY